MTDLSRLSDDELMQLYRAPADTPAAGAQDVAQRVMPDVSGMSDQQLMALHAMPAPAPPGRLESAARGLYQGYTFGFGDEIAGLGAGVRGAVQGRDFGESYREARDSARAKTEAAEKANPWTSAGAKAVGNVVGSIPAIVAAPSMFGMGAGGLAARSAMGAAGGAGLGAVQGLGDGQGGLVEQGKSIGVGALTGGAFGGAAPTMGSILGRAVGPVYQRFVDRRSPVPGVSNEAATMLAEDLANGGGRAAITNRMAPLGPEARLLDAGPAFEGTAQGLSVRPETRQMIVDPLVARRSGANDRLAADLDANFGRAVTPSRVETDLAARRSALSPDYERAFDDARAVDTAGLAGRLEAAIVDTRGGAQRAARDVRDMLDIPGAAGNLDPHPRALMATRQAIDGRLATEADPNTIRTLTAARAEVDAELARAVPGIKAVDVRFADLSRQSEALQRGSMLLDSGKSAVRPAELTLELATSPRSAVPRLREGARAEIDRLVGTQANDLVALKRAVKGDGDWNRDKLGLLFGPDEADRVFRAVDREAAFDAAYQRITQNSATSVRERAAERFRPRGEAAPDSALPLSALVGAAAGGPAGSMAGMLVSGATKIGRAASGEANRLADIARNQEIGRIMVMKPGDQLDTILGALDRRAAGLGAGDQANQVARRMGELLLLSQGNEVGQRGRKALSY